MKIGCSFSPEECEYKGLVGEEVLQAFKLIHKKFSIDNFRLGIRWNRVIDSRGKVDILYYRPLLEYAIKNNLDICLNLGPIKSFRWPEQHVPKSVLNRLSKIPEKGAKINLCDQISDWAFLYLRQLLKQIYGLFEFHKYEGVLTFQPENEAFHPFGEYKWIFDENYIAEVVRGINQFFPESKILLNSSGCKDVGRCIKAFGLAGDDFEKLIIGVNYYYKTPFNQKWPLLSWYDDIARSRLRGFSCRKNKRLARKLGYHIEVSEAQLEGWGKYIKTPGKSFDEYTEMLKKLDKYVLKDSHGVVRVWGIENFVVDYLRGSLSTEQKKILAHISKINRS